MHDGSLATLEDVVEHYDKGGNANPDLDPDMKKLGLTAQEKKDVVAFMKALSGETKKLERTAAEAPCGFRRQVARSPRERWRRRRKRWPRRCFTQRATLSTTQAVRSPADESNRRRRARLARFPDRS